jgi:hydroxymethylbilane synthase
MAERLQGDAIRYEHLFTYLETADIVISSTAAPHPILKKADLQEVIRRRRQKPMFLIDIAVPRDIDPAVNEISNIYLYDIDDLQQVVAANIRERQKEAVVAEEMIKREVMSFQHWLEGLNVVPTIVSLREKAETIRRQEVAKTLRKLQLSEEERTTIDALTTAIVNKLLHTPIVNLKKEIDAPEGGKFLRSVRQLFELDDKANRVVRVGTRGSLLALRQTDFVLDQLASFFPRLSFHKVLIKTIGDLTQAKDIPLVKVGEKGLFIREIEEALLQEQIDLAVHSIKDLPSQLSSGLILGAIPPREDPRDVLVSRAGLSFAQLPKGARVGTSSLRRQAQLLHYRPDLRIVPIRGNIDTRLRKLTEGQYDAIILAAAGLLRMEWEGKITEYLDPEICLPAVGQGALGVEIREDDSEMEGRVSRIHSLETGAAIAAERAFLQRLEGGCQVPAGAWGQIAEGTLVLRGMLSSVDGKRLLTAQKSGALSEAVTIGTSLAAELLDNGGQEILAEIYQRKEQQR